MLAQSFRARVLAFCQRYGTPLWLTFLIGILAFFLNQHGSELRSAVTLIVRGDPRWVLVLVIMQFTTIALVTGKWRMLFCRLGVHVPAQTMLGAYLRRHLIGTVIPLGGPAGLVNFVRDLGKHQVSSGTVLHASMLASLVNQVAFALYLVGALAWLAITGKATGTILIATIVVTVLVIAAFVLVSVLLKRAELPRVLRERLPARALKPISEIRANGVRFYHIALALPFAITVNIAGVAMLGVALMVVGQHPAITAVLAARVASSISGLMLPVLQGGGAVELTMVGALHGSGVPLPQAVAAMVVFRIVQFWIPIALGGLAMVPWDRRTEFPARLAPARLGFANGLFVLVLPLGGAVVAYYTFL